MAIKLRNGEFESSKDNVTELDQREYYAKEQSIMIKQHFIKVLRLSAIALESDLRRKNKKLSKKNQKFINSIYRSIANLEKQLREK